MPRVPRRGASTFTASRQLSCAPTLFFFAIRVDPARAVGTESEHGSCCSELSGRPPHAPRRPGGRVAALPGGGPPAQYPRPGPGRPPRRSPGLPGTVTVRSGPLAQRLPNAVKFRGDGVQALALLAAALVQRDGQDGRLLAGEVLDAGKQRQLPEGIGERSLTSWGGTPGWAKKLTRRSAGQPLAGSSEPADGRALALTEGARVLAPPSERTPHRRRPGAPW